MFKYKKLYETEKNNRKLIEERKKELTDENIKMQKELIELKKQFRTLKEDYTRNRIDLEDTLGFLAQEKECNMALRKERTNLRRKVTNLEKELTNKKGEK